MSGIPEYLRRVETRAAPGLVDRLVRGALAAYRALRSAVRASESPALSRAYLHWRKVERGVAGWQYRFVTLSELVRWTTEWVRSFPDRYDVIVGIPRSGLLVASIVALKLGRPLTTPEQLAEDRCWKTVGMGRPAGGGRILLLDDSVSSGETFRRNLAVVHSACPGWEVTRGALIVTPEARASVDLYYVEIPQPRLFEWNMLHVKPGVLAVDLDGVICENCPPGVDADEERYSAWLASAKPHLIPAFEVDCIVSSRLERYRAETERWLARFGVRYRELILWDIPSKAEARGRHAQHKIVHLVRIKPDMVWESNRYQAEDIWRATRIPTLCVDDMRLLT